MAFRLAASLALAGAPIAGAEAIVLNVVHSGTVASGIDVDGVFGTAGRDLGGLAYSITYSFDTEAPGAIEYHRALADHYVYDQWDLNATTAGARAVMTIDGYTRTFDGSGYTDRQTFNPDLYGVQALTQDKVFFDSGWVTSNVGSPDKIFYGTEDLTQPFSLLLDAGMLDPNNANTESDFRWGDTSLILNQSVMFADGGSAVPEPASWSLLILGFGVIGAALRHGPSTTAQRQAG